VRREKNAYIFSSDRRRYRHGHAFRRGLLTLLLMVLAALIVGNFMVSRHVVLENRRLTVLNLPMDLESYSILHLSDLHGAEYGQRQKAIATALGDTRYSCVVMTGDMLGKDGDTGPLLDLLALMPAETPKFYLPGDMDGPITNPEAHGDLTIYREWAQTLQAAGVTLLDRPVLVTRDKGRIWFVPEQQYALDLESMATVYEREAGVLRARSTSLDADDAARLRVLEYELERVMDIQRLKKEFLPTDIQIVLTHVPLTEDYVSDMVSWGEKENPFSMRYASLILAGHYNGGQWRIPFLGPVYVPELGWLPEDRLVQGLDYLAGIPQHISPGLGVDPHYTWQPGRLFNAPTMTRIELTRKAN